METTCDDSKSTPADAALEQHPEAAESPPDASSKAAFGTSRRKATRKPPSRAEVARRRHGLVAGNLPMKYRLASAASNEFRRQLENAVIDRRGEVSIMDAAFISTAVRFERAALVATWIFREQQKSLEPEKQVAMLNAIATASANRDRSIEKLRLPIGSSADTESPAEFYRGKLVTPFDDAQAAPAAPADVDCTTAPTETSQDATEPASTSPRATDEAGQSTEGIDR